MHLMVPYFHANPSYLIGSLTYTDTLSPHYILTTSPCLDGFNVHYGWGTPKKRRSGDV